jgi:hypothetical protein
LKRWRAGAQGGGFAGMAATGKNGAAQVLPLVIICITSDKAINHSLKAL